MKLARLAVLILVALGAPARAADDPYQEALARGQKLLDKKDAKGAIAAYEAALAARPGDARALSELSWAAVVARDYTKAADAAQKAIQAKNATPALQAASYYNLGRAAEGRGAAADARAAYQASLELRDNPETRKRLAALTSSAAAATRLDGPYANLEAFCKSPEHDGKFCETGDDIQWETANGFPQSLPKPFTALATAKAEEKSCEECLTKYLAFQVGGKWWTLPVADYTKRAASFQLREAKPAGGRLLLRYWYSWGHHTMGEENGIIVCGAGADGAPRCLGPVVTSSDETEDDGEHESSTQYFLRCQAELRAGDQLVVTRLPPRKQKKDEGRVEEEDPAACSQLPLWGKHKISF